MKTRRAPGWGWVLAVAMAAGGGGAALGQLAGGAGKEQGAPGTQRLAAGPLEIDLTLDRERINVAQSVVATLRVVAKRGVVVELPARPEQGSKLGEWTVARVVDEPARAMASVSQPGTLYVRRITLEPFLAGEYTLPELEIGWRMPEAGAATGSARTTAMKMKVESLLPPVKPDAKPDPADLNPGTIREEYTGAGLAGSGALAWAVGTGVVVLFAAGATWVTRRRSAAQDPLEIAYASLSSVPPTPGSGEEMRRACDGVARTVRAGLAARLNPAATTCTARELGEMLRAGLGAAEGEGAEKMLERLDELRFSGAEVDGAEFAAMRGVAVETLAKLRALPREKGGKRA